MIEKLLIEVQNELKEDSIIRKNKFDFSNQIPTLAPGFFRKSSKMLSKRFEMFGGWEDATHGDWLDIHEMEAFWSPSEVTDERLIGIIRNVQASINNWEDDAASLFKEKRISIFAGSSYSYERIYLVWFDFCEEPELWVYDTNGEARYKDLSTYLAAFINDDLSAFSNKWKLSSI